MSKAVPTSEKDWEAEEDVRTLIRAQEVLGDPKRKQRALAQVKKQNEATDKAEAQLVAKTSARMKKVGG